MPTPEDNLGAVTDAPNGKVDSASDERVVNNVMRHEYRVLDDSEKMAMKAIKDAGLAFVQLLGKIGGPSRGPGVQASRELALAQTNIEQAVMWGVKHITK